MTRIAGVFALVVALYAALFAANPRAMGAGNLMDVANIQGSYGVITLGAALVIITGGIDLSIGSVLGLGAVLFGTLMDGGYHPYLAAAAVVALGAAIGLLHGLLVTKVGLQAFLVTLCGMFVYRGAARLLSTRPVGLVGIQSAHPEYGDPLAALRYALVGKDGNGLLVFPAELAVFLVLVVVAGVLLHKSVYGRYWYAIGYNDQAARYAGIDADRYRIAVYVASSSLAAFAGVLELLSYGSVMPNSAGESYELYAITGAVLGGCSLRGGEGTAIGIVLGAAVLPLLKNLVVFLRVPDAVVPAIIGLTLLLGVIVDESIRRGRNPLRAVGRLFGRGKSSGASS